MFSKSTVVYTHYETEEEKKKINLIANRMQICQQSPLYDVLAAAVVNIKNENDIEAVMRQILEERPELQKQTDMENLEQYMFDLYYDIKTNPQVEAISANKNSPFTSMEPEKVNRITIEYLGKITFYMSSKNITSITTNTLQEIFGEDSSKVKYVIDSSPLMTKDRENNYGFISNYVKASIMAKFTIANVINTDLAHIPDFDDENFDTKRNSPGFASG